MGIGLIPGIAFCQSPGTIRTIAGTGVQGSGGDGGLAIAATLDSPIHLAVDVAGNLYITQTGRVRKVDAKTGIITTVAGNGNRGFSGDGGPAIAAAIDRPDGVVVDSAGNLFVADYGNGRVRRVDAVTGIITTFAGGGSQLGSGIPAIAASLPGVNDLKMDREDNLYLNGCQIRRVDRVTSIITTVAGGGNSTADGVLATQENLCSGGTPQGIAIDSVGNLYIGQNTRLRRVDAKTGIITTVFQGIAGLLAIDAADNLFVIINQELVTRVDAKTGSRVAVVFNPAGIGPDDPLVANAGFQGVSGIALDPNGDLLLSDYFHHRIRRAHYYPTPVTIATQPSGFTINVDGKDLVAPQTFNWLRTETHTISATTSQDCRLFFSWDNGGQRSQTITVPGKAVTYTADFEPDPLIPCVPPLRTDIIYTRFDPNILPLRKLQPLLLEVRVGAGIDRVTICLPCSWGRPPVLLPLNDAGTGGDKIGGDRTFSIILQPSDYAAYLKLNNTAVGGLLEAFKGGTRVIAVTTGVMTLKDEPSVNIVKAAQDFQYSRNVANFMVPSVDFFGAAQKLDWVTKRFYTKFGDDFDFIDVIYQGALFRNRAHTVVQNKVSGIGPGTYNNAAQYGSASKLLGITSFPIDGLFDAGQSRFGGIGFLHELAHQWVAFLSHPLLAGGRPHWPLSDLATGIMGFSDPLAADRQGLGFGGDLVKEGDGYRVRNRFGIPQLTYSDLELYLMGLAPAESVQPHFVFRDQNQIANTGTGGFLTGPVDSFTVKDVIAVDGARVPDVSSSQKSFRIATVYVTLDQLASADEMAHFDQAARHMDALFNSATFGAGHIDSTMSDIPNYPDAGRPQINWVETASGGPAISPNAWIAIKGTGLAPADVPVAGLTWSDAPEFASGRMPTKVAGVSVKVHGKPAYVYYVSPTQINALAPLDEIVGTVPVEVTSGTQVSDPFAVEQTAASPALFYFGETAFPIATHADGSLLGPVSMSSSFVTFTPARVGETLALYAGGFGLPVNPLTEGAAAQFGLLSITPTISLSSNVSADVKFAGVVSPGLYLFTFVVPPVPAGDNAFELSYQGTTVYGLLSVQAP